MSQQDPRQALIESIFLGTTELNDENAKHVKRN